MKVGRLFCFVLFCLVMLRFPKPKFMQGYYIFENLSMSRGALTWVGIFEATMQRLLIIELS
jgi:hypothetical protein